MKIREINFKDKRNIFNVVMFVMFFTISIAVCLGCVYIFTDDSLTSEERIVTKYFYAFIDHDWKTVYTCLGIPADAEYLKEEIFIEQMKGQYPDRVDKDYRKDISDVSMSNYLNDDGSETVFEVNYYEGGVEKMMSFSVINDGALRNRVSPDHLTVNKFKFLIPDNTDLTINNERVNEKNRTELLPTEQHYEVCLFKGTYPVILKMPYGQTIKEDIFVGVPKDDGTITDSYIVTSFIPYDADEAAINTKVGEFIRAFYNGIAKKTAFTFSETNYNITLRDKIEEQRKVYMETSDTTFYVSDLKVENVRINSKGVATCDVIYTLTTSETYADTPKSTTIKWKIDIKKQSQNWIIQNISFAE